MKNRIQKNNKGFSLVELLVAIAILAIIVLPLLHSFVTATKTNTKAKKSMEANTVAQNVMEEIKATSFSKLFNSLIYDVSYEYEENPEEGKTYVTFPTQEVNGNSYRVRAEVDSSGYDEEDGFNEQPVADISDMDELQDAFYVQSAQQDRDYAKTLSDSYNYSQPSEEDVLAKMKRVATIKIAQSKSNTDTVSSVEIEYTYSYQRYVGDVAHTVTDTWSIYDNAGVDNGHLRAIYLFYSPLYSSISSAEPLDVINIENKNNADVKVYLTKQSTTNYATENSYKVGINVTESGAGTAWTSSTDFKAATKIRTNIGWSLKKDAKGAYPAISAQPVLLYTNDGGHATQDNARSILDYNTLSGTTKKKHIYKVDVKVYQMTADEEEKWYDDENLLVTYSGSKEE